VFETILELMSENKTAKGPGRLIIAIYAIFALAATARSLYQLATKFDEAPLAYSLSALSALVYIFATVALAKGFAELATYALVFELAGVLIVGTLSVLLPEDFRHATVWSLYGIGYACVPLLLPIWGLWWLGKAKRA
jgi:zinc transporter ZupT